MTPNQAYAQWKQWGADPSDSEAQSIQKFSQQFGLAPNEEDELLKANPEFEYKAPRKSGFMEQTFGAGIDELQKSAGSAIAGPGAEVLSDFGWEGGAGFLEDIGTDIVRQQEEDLQAYEAPQTREELIKEGGVWGSLYENVLPEETQTPQQLGRQALPSLGAAGIALGAAGVAALASGGNPFIVGATAMAVGNAVGSFQVGGEEFEAAKRDPFIRKQLGINPDAKFEDLTSTQQRDLTDSAQRVAKDTMVERLYQGGALESLAFIPYGPLALRYLADIALGATSEEMDKRLGMQNTLEELERLGVSREEIPELREKMKALRPGTFETVWNAAIMEATFGSPTAIIETIAQPDSRIDRRLTAAAEKKRILQKRIEEAQADPIKLEKAENDLIKQDDDRKIRRQKEADRIFDRQKKKEDEDLVDLEKRQKEADEMSGQDREGRTIESSEVNGFTDFIYKAGMTPGAVDSTAREYAEQESARADEWAKKEADKQTDAEKAQVLDEWAEKEKKEKKKKKKKSTSSRSRSSREEVVIQGEGVLDSMDAMENVPAGTAIDSEASDPSGNHISFDKLMQQVALNEYTAAFPQINFKGSTLVKDKNGKAQIIYEDENGDIQSDSDWVLMEGFVDDEQIFGQKESPVVYLTQSMYDDNGVLIKDTKAALERMTEVAFHEAIGHAGLRNILSAGKMLDVDANRDENGKIQNKDYQRWEGEQYNNFIDGFRNRHSKMINRWVEKGGGDIYANESEFRQTEEFIARNYGESGGGKPIGFFDNAAILLREINPFIGNSLTQHQVAKQIQLVVDRYATGIEGKAPGKKNILSGAELVGAISRAATEAGIEKDVETETEIGLVSTRRQKAKSEKKALEALKKPETSYKVMAPKQIQELHEASTILEKAREKQTTGIVEERELLKQMAPVLRKKQKKIKKDTADAKTQAQEEQTSEDLRVVGKAKTSAEVLDGLAKTGTPKVRINVAQHKNTSDETLAILAAVKGQPGVVDAAIKSINKREAAATKVVEDKTREEERAVEKKALNETSLAKARDVVKELNAKLKDKGKLNKADFTRLVKKGERVKELEKTLGITKKGKKSTSKRSKSKRSLSGKRGESYVSIGTDDESLGAEERRVIYGSDISLTVVDRAGNAQGNVPELLDKKGYREGIPITEQKGPVIAAIEDLMLGADEKGQAPKKDPHGRQIRAKLSPVLNKKIARIRRDKIKELTKIKTELNKLLSTTSKISNPKKWVKISPVVEELRGKIRELTEGRDLTKKEVKESKFMEDLRARPWEFFGVGLFLSQNDRNLSLIKSLKGQGKSEYSLSAEDVVDIDILEAGIAIESIRVDLNNSLLSLKGIDERKPKVKKVYKELIKKSEKTITELEKGRIEYQKEIGGDINYAFDNILNEKERAALIYDMGMSKEYGMMDQSQIAALMKEEGVTTSKGHAPRQQWVSKQINNAIEKIRESMGYGINKIKPPEKGKNYYENYQLVKPWLKSVLTKYPKTTGEKTKTGKARTKEVAKDEAETKRRWDELLTGRLALDSSGNIPKGLRPERTEAATALYRDTGLITKPESKENWKAWGDISDEDMAYLKEAAGNPRSKAYEWRMIRPPAGTDVVSEDILGEVDPATDEVKKTMDELMNVQFDAIYNDPVLFEKAIKGMSREKLEGLSDAYLRKVDPKSKSKRSIRGFGGKSAKIDRNIKEKILASDVMKSLRYFMTPTELESLTKETIDAIVTLSTKGKTRTGKNITITKLRDKEGNIIKAPRLNREALAAMAYAGRFKKGWYRHGALQLRRVFLTDTNRFIALLAATSPQTSVEMNLENSLRIWNNWEKAGRPTGAKEIKQIMGRSVVGKGTEESVMDAWVNNSITALSASDPTKIELSGPKADSFMQNLLENLTEVTLDTWQGRAYNLLQDVFGGIQRKATEGRGVKSPGYILSAAKTREAAAFLSKKTGTKWEPAEIQETIWSFVKALYEKRKSPAGRTTPMDSLFLTLSQNEIANVPDFASLISTNKYGSILNEGKYGKRISSVKKFQTSAEAVATPSYRGLEATLNRITQELESQFRTTNTSRVTKGIRDKIHRGVVADRDGTGGGKRTFTGRSERNPGGKLAGLGKLTKYNLTELDRKRLNSLGVSTPEFFEIPKSSEAGAIFQTAIQESKKEHPHGAAVYVYTSDEYSTFKNFLTKDGKTGFSVKPNGDIVSVFNTPSAGRPASSLTSLMLAVENGGTKLDAFDTILPQLYSRAGFRISSRMAWNDEFAPTNWDKKAFSAYNKGEPDVVFMHYDPDSTEVYNAPIGKRKKKEEAGRESVLFDDYDAAVNLQTRNVEESQGRFKKAKRIPGKQAERMGHKIPKAPWKIEERSLVPAVVRTITDPNFRVMPVSKSKRSRSEVSRSTFSAGADQRFGSRWTNFWLKQLAKIKPLSQLKEGSKEFYLQLRQVAFGQLAQWEFFSNSVFKALKDSKQSKEIYKYLTTPNANSSIISDPNERVHAEKAKRAIERIGETLVSKKLMKETTLRDFKKKHGDYLPRIYLRHLLNESDRTAIARGLKPSNLDYLKKRRDIPKGIRELILGELTDQQGAPALLASRALMVPGKDLAIMSWIQKMKDLSIAKGLEWVVPEQFVTFNTLEEARDIAKGMNNSIIKELELDVDFSDMSTEVTPAWLKTESDKLRLMAMDLQGDKKKIVTELYRRMEDRAAEKEPMFREGVKIDGYRKLPNSARYGAMRGMWIHKQIADDIIGGMKLATGDESNWEKIVGETGFMGKYNAYWKWAKVAGNPPSWARNYISNNILLTLAGIPFWSIPKLNLAAMKEMRTKGKYYQIALKQGVMAGNMSSAELGRMETDFLEIERNMSESGNPLTFLKGIKGATGKVMDWSSNIYGGLETLGKIGAIKYAMEQKGMNESEAAAFANKWLFDYGLVTPSVRYASTAVVGAPFIRFQSHAIPLMLEVGLTKPWRFLPYYALGYGMIEMFKNSHDIDEEEYESIKKALAPWLQEKALNPKFPGTNIPLLPPNVLPMPYLDKQGRWQIHDVSYLMPWGMMTEVAGETLKGQFSDAMKSLGLMGGPLADAMVVLKTGVDPFTRRPITDDTKPYIDQVGDYIKYIYNMSMPSMFHTSHGAVNRIWDSAMGNLDPKTGEMKYEPLQAWLRLGGQNIYPTNLVEQRRTNIRRMKWEMGNLKTAWTRRLRGLMKSKASQEEINEAREEYRELLKERQLEMRDYVRQSRVPQSLRAG